MSKKNPTFEAENPNRLDSVNLHFNKGLPAMGNVSERSELLTSVRVFSPKVGSPACNPYSMEQEKIVGNLVEPTRQPLPSDEILKHITSCNNANLMREHLRELWDTFALNDDLDPDYKIDIYNTYKAIDSVLKELALHKNILIFK